MLKKSIHLFLFSLIVTFASEAVFAEQESVSHERWYQVEMLIFSRSETSQEEHWPNDFVLAYPANLLRIQNADGEGSIVSTPTGLLNTQAAGIAKNSSYLTLYHQAWRQKIIGRKTHLLVTGGKIINGHHELEGSIALSVGQYLKFQSNLWLTKFAPAGTSVLESWPALPTLNDAKMDEPKTSDAVITRIVKIAEQRNSMRSNEVHYIDHPLVGIFIKIVPIN